MAHMRGTALPASAPQLVQSKYALAIGEGDPGGYGFH